MTKLTRRWVILAAIISALIAVLMFFVATAKGIDLGLSNCNRDCDDGAGALYASFVCVGLAIVLALVAALAPRKPAAPTIPEARARPK
jgi:hypothetical protein